MQKDVGYKVRRAIEGKMEALRALLDQHKRAEKEKQMAVRYHRVKISDN